MLKRKLWRDIKANYGAYLACISVLVIGLMLYVSMSITLDSMNQSTDRYYREFGFADGFAQIVAGPEGLVDEIGQIRGIDRVVGRIVQDVMVYDPTGDTTTTVRMVSYNEVNQPVNRFKLEAGRLPVKDHREMLVSPAFMDANGYKIGDKIPLIFFGREVQFTVTGTVNSPEYVFETQGSQYLTPDPKSFGIAFTPTDSIAPLLQMNGKVNDIAFSLSGGVDFQQVKQPLTKMLKQYGLMRVYPLKDQLSNSLLQQELVQLKGSASTTPVIFLTVAAVILYIVLRRMIEQQRGQIGIMKAFGFTEWEILSHYMGYPLIIGGLGGLFGGLTGAWLSFYFAKIYQQYYNIPDLTGRFSIGYIMAGTVISVAFSLAAGYQGCKRVLVLSSSEAMRPEAPKIGRRIFLERLNFLWQSLNSLGKMAVRNVFRSKQRSIIAILGIACAFGMMVASRAMFDATYYLISFQYDQIERYDLKIGLRQYVRENEGVSAAKQLDGVAMAEPLLEVPVTIGNKWLEKETAIMGLPAKGTLYKLLDSNEKEVSIPNNGLVISSQMAKILEIKSGDKVSIKPFLGDATRRQVVVTKIVPQYVGMGAYMEINALSKLLQSSPITSSILIKTDKNNTTSIRKEIQSGKNVLAIQDKTRLKAQFEQLMESNNASQYILVFFAFVMGFAIVYNINIISLSERERELATLMVLGMTEKEVARVLIMEQGLLGSIAVILGIPLSYGLLYGIATASASEIYNMPIIILPASMLTGLLGTVLFMVAAQWKITDKIGKLSMLDVLKQQE